MKTTKKLLALALALILVLGLCTVSFADDPAAIYDITVASGDTHTYEIYQIFTGDLADGVLSNVKWGENGKEYVAGAVTAVDTTILEELEDVAASTDDNAKLAVILKYAVLTGEAIATVDAETPYAAVPGYYLIKDASPFAPAVDENDNPVDAETLYIVEIVDDVEIERKEDGIPGSEKWILVDDQEVAVCAAGIGDTITYEIKAEVPAAAAAYDYYYFVINDTMDDGLDFKLADANMTVQATGSVTPTYAAYDTEEDYSFRLAITNAKALAGQTITVTYDAVLNDTAAVKVAEKNTENVTYSNNPNFKYYGETTPGEEPEIPGKPDEPGVPGSDVPTGETPDNVVETYTTKLTVFKIDQDENILTGAEFTLTGDANKVKVSTTTTFVADENGTYYELQNGKYTTKAPTDDTATLYSNTETKYKKSVITTTMTDSDDADIKAYVAADGTVSFEGLGVGDYVLTESATPAGYNTVPDIEFSIDFEDGEFTAEGGDIELDADNGFYMTVKNVKGSTLPETGGIGTTIFYILGSVMLCGAAIVLLAKKYTRVQG